MDIDVISGNEKIIGEKIRYINYNDANYFIYSLKEIDEEGYEKLYINKIYNNEEDIINDIEWEELKKIIPTIVKQIKADNIIDFKDLDLKSIENINSNYSRPFKLKSSIVSSIKKVEKIYKIEEELQELVNRTSNETNNTIDDLDEFLNNYEEELNNYEEELNKNEEELNNIEVPIRPDFEENDKQEIEEKQLKEALEQEKNKTQELQKKIEELELEINKYKDKIERIKIMLEA